MFEFLVALGAGIAGLVIWLVVRNKRNAGRLDALAAKRNWTVETKLGRDLPEALRDETVLGLGDPDNDFAFDIYKSITGEFGGREIILISRRQKHIKRTELSDQNFAFTRLQGTEPYPVMQIIPASKVLNAWGAVDDALAEANGMKPPGRPEISHAFDHKHTVVGHEGSAQFMTRGRQEALLAKPELFRREDESWHKRFFAVPGLSQQFAWLCFPDLDPNTIFNRLESLIDWAEIAEDGTMPRS